MKTEIGETEKIRALLDDCVKKYWLIKGNFDNNNPYNVEQYITWSDEVQSVEVETEEWKCKCFAQEKEIDKLKTTYTTDYLLNWVIA